MDFPDFSVACGEEASDPVVLHEGRVVRVDELAASGHLDRQDADLADVAGLGVRVWRYGMPWRLAEPTPGAYDWALWDRAFAACERAGLEPVVDLCHFGLPDHLPGGFGDPAWVEAFARYVDAFLARYPEPRWFTPVNEPGITALLSGLFGIWNERGTTLDQYARAVAHVALANLEALARIDADRSGWWIGAEGFGCELADADDEAGTAAAVEARDLQWLVWDLQLGVAPRGGAIPPLDAVDPAVLARIEALAGAGVPPERTVAGHDLYPVSVTTHGRRAERPVTVEDRVAAYEATAAAWHDRYLVPFWVAETSNLGLDVDEGPEWLAALVNGLDRLAAAGRPVRGICWYSRGDQYDWQTALAEPVGALTEVGLFTADRVPRPVAGAYADLAAARRF